MTFIKITRTTQEQEETAKDLRPEKGYVKWQQQGKIRKMRIEEYKQLFGIG